MGLVKTVVVVGLHQPGDNLGVVVQDAPDGAEFGAIKRQLFWPVRVNYFGRFLSSAKARCLAVCWRKLST